VEKEKLVEIVDTAKECSGNVIMATEDGDRLNIKENADRLVLMHSVFGGKTIPSFEIETDNPRDTVRYLSVMLRSLSA